MPVLYQGDSNMILYPISYSPSALERAFDVSGTTDILGVPALIVLRKDKRGLRDWCGAHIFRCFKTLLDSATKYSGLAT